jgi:2-amino-4-hydroxy-6-hydroxymethyldihydropteridine diphosphokinase
LSSSALISIGSNLGDRRAAITFAVDRLSQLLENPRVSDVIETAPAGEAYAGQPPFLNAVVAGTTNLSARALLERLLSIEREFGRERPHAAAPRTLDLDLILLGDEVIDEPDLRVPHPRFREREFVLRPAAQVAAECRDPVTKLTVKQLFEQNKKGPRARARGPS